MKEILMYHKLSREGQHLKPEKSLQNLGSTYTAGQQFKPLIHGGQQVERYP